MLRLVTGICRGEPVVIALCNFLTLAHLVLDVSFLSSLVLVFAGINLFMSEIS